MKIVSSALFLKNCSTVYQFIIIKKSPQISKTCRDNQTCFRTHTATCFCRLSAHTLCSRTFNDPVLNLNKAESFNPTGERSGCSYRGVPAQDCSWWIQINTVEPRLRFSWFCLLSFTFPSACSQTGGRQLIGATLSARLVVSARQLLCVFFKVCSRPAGRSLLMLSDNLGFYASCF